jgi:hypothetical protein
MFLIFVGAQAALYSAKPLSKKRGNHVKRTGFGPPEKVGKTLLQFFIK